MKDDAEQTSKTKSALQKHKQNYQKFMNSVYQSLKQKQYSLKRGSLVQIPSSLPKVSGRDITISNSEKEEKIHKKRSTAHPSSRAKVFKSFVSHINEQQKRINLETMNLLGLQVKKASYTERSNPRLYQPQNQLFQSLRQTSQTKDNEYQAHQVRNKLTIELRNNSESLNPIQLLCCKVNLYGKDMPHNSRWSKAVATKYALRRKQGSKMTHRKHLTSQYSSRQKVSGHSQISSKKIKIVANPDFVNPIYDGRFKKYRQFIFKLNYAHRVYFDLTRYDDSENIFALKNDKKFKAWVGPGNNCKLIKTLIKRRFWWTLIEDRNPKTENTNFIWTQLKLNDFFKGQDSAIQSVDQIDDKNQRQASREKIIGADLFRSIKKRKQNKEVKILSDQGFFYKVFTEKQGNVFKERVTKVESKSYDQKQEILKLRRVQNTGVKVHNHLINNFYLGNKKALFYNLSEYYKLTGQAVFERIPLTFHIKAGLKDAQYKRFVVYYKERQTQIKVQENQMQKGERSKGKTRNVWIVKPGQLTNRGHGITVIDEIHQLDAILKREGKHQNGSEKTFIVQLYIDRPFLYQKRKFDIRHYILVTHLHGLMRGYWFTEGYIRTCSYEFDIQDFARQIHLTNDAVQKYTPTYGQYQPANKLSYSDFQRYLDTLCRRKYNFEQTILSQIKKISLDAIKSAYLKLSPQRLKHNFEIFGLDFMIDSDFKPWLIEINTNPCLELNCPLLQRLIPQVVDQALRLSLDVIFPPPCHYPNTQKHLVPETGLQSLKFELIFDEKRDGTYIKSLYKQVSQNDLLAEIGDVSEDQIYQDEDNKLLVDDVFNL